MLPVPGAVDLGTLVHPVTSVDPAPAALAATDQRLATISRLEQFAVGQQIQAKVVSLFQDGSALVKIGETAARMVLPANARPGASVLLTLTSKDPRPTFSMQVESEPSQEESAAGLGAAARPPIGGNTGYTGGASLAQTELGVSGPALRGAGSAAASGGIANAPPPSAPPGAPSLPSSVNITLSTAGQMINNLLQAQPSGTPAAIAGRTPALAGPPTMPTPEIATALQNSVSLSGAFYESHVAQWVDGTRTLADLQHEPQAQIGHAIDNTALLTRPDAASTQIGNIVNVQLNTLDQQRITWQGEVWPGQHMQWDIARDNSDHTPQPDGQEAPPSWQSVVRFNFEHLGTVAASIRLVGNQIHMQIRANNESATNALRSHGSELIDSMAAAGSSLDSLIVKREGPG
ncbi:MAG TPA: flagellar hook-length control protein FliK [Herbaspirillum sp.]|nr:flagellar hook-length control protein FliK [Herbaspirillum sp.]